jgi:hypothetical protein
VLAEFDLFPALSCFLALSPWVELGSWVLLAGAHCLKLSPLIEEVLLPFHTSHAKKIPVPNGRCAKRVHLD